MNSGRTFGGTNRHRNNTAGGQRGKHGGGRACFGAGIGGDVGGGFYDGRTFPSRSTPGSVVDLNHNTNKASKKRRGSDLTVVINFMDGSSTPVPPPPPSKKTKPSFGISTNLFVPASSARHPNSYAPSNAATTAPQSFFRPLLGGNGTNYLTNKMCHSQAPLTLLADNKSVATPKDTPVLLLNDQHTKQPESHDDMPRPSEHLVTQWNALPQERNVAIREEVGDLLESTLALRVVLWHAANRLSHPANLEAHIHHRAFPIMIHHKVLQWMHEMCQSYNAFYRQIVHMLAESDDALLSHILRLFAGSSSTNEFSVLEMVRNACRDATTKIETNCRNLWHQQAQMQVQVLIGGLGNGRRSTLTLLHHYLHPLFHLMPDVLNTNKDIFSHDTSLNGWTTDRTWHICKASSLARHLLVDSMRDVVRNIPPILTQSMAAPIKQWITQTTQSMDGKSCPIYSDHPLHISNRTQPVYPNQAQLALHWLECILPRPVIMTDLDVAMRVGEIWTITNGGDDDEDGGYTTGERYGRNDRHEGEGNETIIKQGLTLRRTMRVLEDLFNHQPISSISTYNDFVGQKAIHNSNRGMTVAYIIFDDASSVYVRQFARYINAESPMNGRVVYAFNNAQWPAQQVVVWCESHLPGWSQKMSLHQVAFQNASNSTDHGKGNPYNHPAVRSSTTQLTNMQAWRIQIEWLAAGLSRPKLDGASSGSVAISQIKVLNADDDEFCDQESNTGDFWSHAVEAMHLATCQTIDAQEYQRHWRRWMSHFGGLPAVISATLDNLLMASVIGQVGIVKQGTKSCNIMPFLQCMRRLGGMLVAATERNNCIYSSNAVVSELEMAMAGEFFRLCVHLVKERGTPLTSPRDIHQEKEAWLAAIQERYRLQRTMNTKQSYQYASIVGNMHDKDGDVDGIKGGGIGHSMPTFMFNANLKANVSRCAESSVRLGVTDCPSNDTTTEPPPSWEDDILIRRAWMSRTFGASACHDVGLTW